MKALPQNTKRFGEPLNRQTTRKGIATVLFVYFAYFAVIHCGCGADRAGFICG